MTNGSKDKVKKGEGHPEKQSTEIEHREKKTHFYPEEQGTETEYRKKKTHFQHT